MAQTVASGIAAGILSGGTAVINHMVNTLKAKGVNPAQLPLTGGNGGNNGGANGGNSGGGNGGNSGGGNGGNSGGANGGNNGGANGGNNGGANGGGLGEFPASTVVYIGGNNNKAGGNVGNNGGGNNGGANLNNAGTSFVFQQGNNGEANVGNNGGESNGGRNNGGGSNFGGGISIVNGGSQGSDAGRSSGNGQNLGTTYVFNAIDGNRKPTVSGTQRQVRKPDNNLGFNGPKEQNEKNSDEGIAYKFNPVNGGNNKANGLLAMSDSHKILVPSHGIRMPLSNVHKEGHHVIPMEAADNIGSVLNELVSLIPHEDYHFNIGADDIHVKPPSITSSVMINDGAVNSMKGTGNGGIHIHGSKKKLIHELAEIKGKVRIENGKAKKAEKLLSMKKEDGKNVIHRHDNDDNDDIDDNDDNDDDFDIDADKEDADEKEDDKVPSNDEKEAEEKQDDRNERELANGKDLEEVFDELEDKDEKEAVKERGKKERQKEKVNGEQSARKEESKSKPSFQDYRASSLQKAITRRQQFLVNKKNIENVNKMSKIRENSGYSRMKGLPIEIKDAWPGTLAAKRSFNKQEKENEEYMNNKSSKEMSGKMRYEVNEQGLKKRGKITENPKITYMDSVDEKNGERNANDKMKSYYKDDSMKENVSTRELAKKITNTKKELMYDNDDDDDGINGRMKKENGREKKTKERENRNPIARINEKEQQEKKLNINYERKLEMRKNEVGNNIKNNGKNKMTDEIEGRRGEIVAGDLSGEEFRNAHLFHEKGIKRGQAERDDGSRKVSDFAKIISEKIQSQKRDMDPRKHSTKVQIDTNKSLKLRRNKKKARENAKAKDSTLRHKLKFKKKDKKMQLKRKQEVTEVAKKRNYFDMRKNKKEIADIAVKAFLPLLMNKIQHKIESNQGQKIHAYYPNDGSTKQTTNNAQKKHSEANSIQKGLKFALLSNLFKGQNVNSVQRPQIINRLRYPVYFIPPVKEEKPPVLSVGPEPAYLPPLNIQHPPVASINPEPPLLPHTSPVLPPVASIGAEPFFQQPKPTNRLPIVASIRKDPAPFPTKSPSVKGAPVKPSPTKKKEGKDQMGRSRHITPSMMKISRRFGPTENLSDDYHTESSLHNDHHNHHNHYEDDHGFSVERLHDMHESSHEDLHEHVHEDIHAPYGTESSIHNTMSVGQGNHGHYDHYEEYRYVTNDDRAKSGEQRGFANAKVNGILSKKLSKMLPGFVLVPGHEKGNERGGKIEGKRSTNEEMNEQASKLRRNVKINKIKKKKYAKKRGKRRIGIQTEKGTKRSQNIDKVTIANAAVKALMPFILKSIVQKKTRPKKVIYVPIPVPNGDASVITSLSQQQLLPSVHSIGPEPNVPVAPPANLLPPVSSIGPEPNVPVAPPANLLPPVSSIGPEPNVPAPPPSKMISSVPSIGKDPGLPPTEAKQLANSDKEKKKEDETKIGAGGKEEKSKKENKKEEKKEEKKEDKTEDKKKDKDEDGKAGNGKTRHLTPKLIPFHLDISKQEQIEVKFSKSENGRDGKGFVLVPHHEEDKKDRAMTHFEHYGD